MGRTRTDDAFPRAIPAACCDVAGKLFFAYTPPGMGPPWALNNQSVSPAERARRAGLRKIRQWITGISLMIGEKSWP